MEANSSVSSNVIRTRTATTDTVSLIMVVSIVDCKMLAFISNVCAYGSASNLTDPSVFLRESCAHYGQKSKNTEEK